VCQAIREARIATSLIVLSAPSQTTDKVVALRLGADDCVTKLFKSAELVARVQAWLLRVRTRSGQGVYEFGSLRVDFRTGAASRKSWLLAI
jgi:DNA-binding response OmpR family regulator